MSQTLRDLPLLVRLTFLSRNPDHTVGGLDYERRQVDPARGDRSRETGRQNLCLVSGAMRVTPYDLIRDLSETHRVVDILGDTSHGRTDRDEVSFRTTLVWLKKDAPDGRETPHDKPLEEWLDEIERIFYPSGAGAKMATYDGVYVYLNDTCVTVNMPFSGKPVEMGEPIFHLCWRPNNARRPFPLYLDEEDDPYSTLATERETRLAAYGWAQVSTAVYRTLKNGEELHLDRLEAMLTRIIGACSDRQFQIDPPSHEESARAASWIFPEVVLQNQRARWAQAQAERATREAAKASSAS